MQSCEWSASQAQCQGEVLCSALQFGAITLTSKGTDRGFEEITAFKAACLPSGYMEPLLGFRIEPMIPGRITFSSLNFSARDMPFFRRHL
jgi:hypothetical protein